ncbi:L-methionine gamma-lyase-like [Mytilus californianus]|uniref:L-methionine gamma-lyase-like n=1 Tax=Mytilus californianus TaxID=6549 RepID=UPI002245FFD7|nr:L-methionine gamma-lyase-like [Mytilus californianus]
MSRKWQPPLTTLERGLHGLNLENVSMDTVATSARFVFDGGPSTEPLVPPIYHASTYKLKSVDDYLKILDEGGYIYSRLNNFTCDSVQAAINVIEGGKGTLVFNTGMSAISTALFCFLKSGDHIIICNPVYSGIYDIAVNMFPKFNIEVSFVQAGSSVEEYTKQIKPNTKMLYGETPCNPNMAILDLEEFGKLGKSRNILTMVDNTFASPYLQPVIKYGIDISMHSCTKYLGGHSDLIAGSLTFSSVELWQTTIRYQTTLGASLSPHDASLLLRGIKTLPLRMERHSSNAMKVAKYLEKHPKINYVLYPGLESHPHHQIAKKQMKSFSGMMSVEAKGGLGGGRILAENLRIVQLAVSLGGVESLIQHPATMTHGPMLMSDEDRRSGGITDGMVRISIGIEDPDDLIADFKQALDKIPESLCAET